MYSEVEHLKQTAASQTIKIQCKQREVNESWWEWTLALPASTNVLVLIRYSPLSFRSSEQVWCEYFTPTKFK